MRPPQHRFALILVSLTIAACLASAGLAADPAHSSAAQPDPASEQTARQAASSRTQDLLSLHQRWQQAAPQDKQQSRELLLAQAEQRRQMLAELAKSNPAEVLRVAIPADKRAGLPAELLPLLEEQVEIEGELEVVHVDDFENPGQSRIEYALKTSFGERFTLHEAAKSAKELQSGQRVRLNGLLVPPAAAAERADDGDIVVNSFDEDILSLAASNSASYGSQPGVQANTVGEQRTLVMMVNFQDAPSNKPWTSADMQALFTNQINPFYQEVSYGQTWFKATVFGWQTIATNSSSCDRTAITNQADQAATAAGHVLSNYDRLVYAFPQNNSCGWGGLGTVGGKPSRAWLNGSFGRAAYTHELGHNLGLFHSNNLDCGSTTLGSSCTVGEYGDLADTMGGGQGHFNAYQKDRLGWFGNRILSVSNSGSYRLSPFEFGGSQPLALKALKSVDPTNGAKTWYYLEYRQAVGYDSSLDTYSTSNLHKGVSIHSGVDLNGNTSHMLDMTPGTSSWRDAALEAGRNFNDSTAGVSIFTQFTDTKEALVDVSLGAQQCIQNNPSISLVASSDNWVTAGTAVSYSLTVSNKDSSSCGSRSFSLSAGVPSGWAKSLSQSALSLAPGASASATLTVTSASGATAAIYDISASAVSGNNSATATAAYVVEAAASNSPPVAKNDSGSTSANTAVTIAVLTNDTDPDGDSLSVTTISGVSNGTAKLNSNGTISFTPASGYSGTTGFSYSISDGKGGSASAQVSVSVATSSLQAPVANADQVSLSSLSPVVIPVLANDSDPQGAKLTVIGVTQGSKGSVTVNAGGSLTYSPSRGLKTSDSFTYTISNGSKSASASVTVTLQQSSGSAGGKGNGKNG